MEIMGYDLIQQKYHGTKVLVTGHTGFKGSWLALWLAQLGAEVTGIALPPETTPNHFELLHPDITSHIFDIGDLGLLKATIEKSQPEIIFHLASQALVLPSYDNPLATFSTNVIGLANLFEAIKTSSSVKAVVIVTSDKCYQNNEWLWGYRENEPLGGYDPYSLSKACQEHVATAYRNAYFPLDQFNHSHSVLIATARAGNVIGGGDWATNRLMVDLVRAADKGEQTTIRHPDAVRPWQHVLDCLHGYLKLGRQLLIGNKAFSGAWNFAPMQCKKLNVKSLCQIAQNNWPRINYQELTSAATNHEARLLYLDASKAYQELNWQPQLTMTETIQWTIDWYRQFYEENSVMSSEQLTAYQAVLVNGE